MGQWARLGATRPSARARVLQGHHGCPKGKSDELIDTSIKARKIVRNQVWPVQERIGTLSQLGAIMGALNRKSSPLLDVGQRPDDKALKLTYVNWWSVGLFNPHDNIDLTND